VISIRRMSLGSGYRYLMESVAVGDGAGDHRSGLTRYYAESGTPPGIFLGAGLASLDGGRGVEAGSQVGEEHLLRMLGLCADPISGEPLGRTPNQAQPALERRIAERVLAIPATVTGAERSDLVARIETEEKARSRTSRPPVAGFDLTFSPSKSVSSAWAVADEETKAVIYDCHRRAIDIVVAYAEREVFHSRSGTNGIVQEDIVGVVAASFTHWDSRAGDPQLHDHIVVLNRAQSISDGRWRTLDSRGLFKATVALSELHQGVLSDLLTQELGWGWDGRPRRHSDGLRFEVSGVPQALMAEFSQRAKAIEARKEVLVAEFVAARGRQPTSTEVLDLRRRATLETRPDKTYRSLAEMTGDWRRRATPYVGNDPESWVTTLAGRNDLPLLRSGDLAEEILSDVARVAAGKVAEARATFSRANVAAEVHRQLHGVRFATPADRIAVAGRAAEIALCQSLLLTPPVLHHTPAPFRRADGTSRLRPKGHEVYTSHTVLEAEARLLDAARRTDGPEVGRATVAAVSEEPLPGRTDVLSVEQAVAVEQIATSGRVLDVLVGPAGTGKSTTMAGLRAVWEAEHGPGSVIGLAPSAAAAEVLAAELGIDTENTAKWLTEHRLEPTRRAEMTRLRARISADGMSRSPSNSMALRARLDQLGTEVARWQLRSGQLVIIDEASLAGTFALDELVTAAADAEAKVLLVGDWAQLSAVDAGGMFRALVSDREHVPELSEVRRFRSGWERRASLGLRTGDDTVIDAYLAHGRILEGARDELLESLYLAWRADIDAGKSSLMIAPDLGTVAALNARARADRIAAGHVAASGVTVAGGATIGVGDLVVTRQNERHLATGTRWVKNGDRWTVTAVGPDGTLTVKRANGGGQVTLPAGYVAEHVELGYATTAHRAEGLTVDTAHAMVSPTTTREVLYVLATRGREANLLYVDTHYDPDPQTGHDGATPTQTAREVVAGVLGNEGADVAAHGAIRRAQHDAESIATLAAEYQTIAAAAQADRWDALLAQSGLSDTQLDAIAASDARGPLFAAVRDAEARGLDVDTTLPSLVRARTLVGTDDVTAVLHHRVERWAEAARRRRRPADNLIAGLIPRAVGISDPDMALALRERDDAMERRAYSLVEQAAEHDQTWLRQLGPPPTDLASRAGWVRRVVTVAAYRERWSIRGDTIIGRHSGVSSIEQLGQHKRAIAAIEHALALAHGKEPATTPETRGAQIGAEPKEGVEL
jgi:conjugative relaxase-like TrwC/TraI family protein